MLAGEPSGDAIGAHLMASLKASDAVTFRGVGGSRMQGEGLRSLFPMGDLSHMGFAELLPHFPR